MPGAHNLKTHSPEKQYLSWHSFLRTGNLAEILASIEAFCCNATCRKSRVLMLLACALRASVKPTQLSALAV